MSGATKDAVPAGRRRPLTILVHSEDTAKPKSGLAAMILGERAVRRSAPEAQLLSRRCVGVAGLLERVRVYRADEGNDPPKIVARLDDATEGRHRPHDDLVLHPGVALLL